jgi:putative hydrolase of the HAD superfamily
MTNMDDEINAERTRVVLFDAAGTLFQVKEPVWEVYASHARNGGWSLDPARIRQSFRAVWASLPPPPWEIVGADPEKLWWHSLVKEVFARSGAAGAEGAAFEECFEGLWTHYAQAGAWQVYPEVLESLRQLKGRYRLGIVSNFDERLFSVLSGLELEGFFERVTISSHARVRKPALAIFQRALERHEIPAEHALHVGDDPDADWSGARRAGIRAFLLNRPKVTLSHVVSCLVDEKTLRSSSEI